MRPALPRQSRGGCVSPVDLFPQLEIRKSEKTGQTLVRSQTQAGVRLYRRQPHRKHFTWRPRSGGRPQCLTLQGPVPRSGRHISASIPDQAACGTREESPRRRQTINQSDRDGDRFRPPEPSRASHASGAGHLAEGAARDHAIKMRQRFLHKTDEPMKNHILFIAPALILASICVHAQNTNRSATVEQLKRATQELLDAVAPGDVAVWQRYLAEDCIYTDEEGNVKTKEDLLKELKPLPKSYIGSIKMGDPKVFVEENVIVLSHRDREELEVYGQKQVTYFHSTDTWTKIQNGQWKLAAVQVMAIPNERKPIAVDPNKLDAYVGQYQLAPDVIYTITREGNKLFGQRTGRAKEELLSLCEDTFYKKGVWRGEKVFERDAKGRIVNLLDRRENNDIVWKKVK